jgi:hypothetical protein
MVPRPTGADEQAYQTWATASGGNPAGRHLGCHRMTPTLTRSSLVLGTADPESSRQVRGLGTTSSGRFGVGPQDRGL